MARRHSRPMKLTPNDFPLIAEGNRIYTQQRPQGQVLVAIDADMAEQVARMLNESAAFVSVPHLGKAG